MTEENKNTASDNKKILGEKLSIVSSGPGVYLMKNNKSKIIYVGKAKNLQKRLTSYFKRSDYSDLKTSVLVNKISAFDTIVTETEQEALILEASLITKHKPQYNIILKDDKKYPSLRLDIKTDFPNITIHRKVVKDGALYFGPYTSSGALNQTLKIINKTFKLRKCKNNAFKKRSRPCLNYQIGLCLAPCCKTVDKKKYDKIVKEVTLFLRGRTPELIKTLKSEMVNLAEMELFEEAGQLRDKIFALEKILEKQVVVSNDLVDRDVIAITRGEQFSLVTVLSITGGILTGSRHFKFTETIADDSEIIDTFIRQHYEKSPNIPAEILIMAEPDGIELLEVWLTELRNRRAHIIKPLRGDKAKLLKLAVKNGAKELEERVAQGRLSMEMLIRLRNVLKMDKIPEHIECFDNSNISGTDPVASMVVFKNAVAHKPLYRKYKIKTVEIQDDYSYMAEILSRRYGKSDEEQPYPDLLIVDGGKGQLNIAVSIMKELGIYGDFDIIGIAKKDETKGEEYDKIYKPFRSNAINFNREGELLLFLQRIRDEAHRFAITFHRAQRDKKTTLSVLDSVAGIGPKRKSALLRYFGGISHIKKATVEELLKADGMNKKTAEDVLAALNSN